MTGTGTTSSRYLSQDSPWLLALLAALVALGPLSVDMYLPAMPAMMAALGTDIPQMHLTLSAYLGGFAIFHLACGPLADRFGRKPVLTGGTVLFVLACVGCSRSTSVEQLLVYRFLQGVGACVGPTLGRTVARDLFGPVRAARALSLIAMLMALAPAIAPAAGGIMLIWLPWSSIFYFLAIYGACMLVVIQLYLGESMPQRQSLHPLAIARNYGQLLADARYVSATIASGLLYAGLIAYLSSSSFVYIEMLGVPVEYFGLIFITTVIGYIAGSALSARLSLRRDSDQVMLLGATLALAAGGAMLGGHLLQPASVLALALPSALYTAALGLMLPHAMTVSLQHFAHIAATASALLGFIQMALSSAASALAGRLLRDSPLPMLWIVTTIGVLSLALALNVRRLGRVREAHRDRP
jgi:DHA1 family bicyclomycin/chloramphenicol resistance-like MFS transporter